MTAICVGRVTGHHHHQHPSLRRLEIDASIDDANVGAGVCPPYGGRIDTTTAVEPAVSVVAERGPQTVDEARVVLARSCGGVRGDRRTTAMWSNLSSIQAMVTDRGPEACSRDLVTFGWCYASRSECWVLCSGRAWWVPVDWPGMVKVGVGQWQLAHRQLGDGCEARGEPAGQRVCMRRRRQSGVDHNLAPQVWSCHVPTGSAGSSRPHAAETQPGCAVTPQSTRTRALQPLA